MKGLCVIEKLGILLPSAGSDVLVLEARNLNNPTPSATEWSAVWGVRTACGSACRRHATVCRTGSSVRHAWRGLEQIALNCQSKTFVIKEYIV